jgi:integrase
MKARLWKSVKLGTTPDYLWQHAVKQWIVDKKGKLSLEKDKMIFRGVRKYLDGVKLKDIDRKLLKTIADKKAKETSEATANRHMQLIRAVLNKAANEWEWIPKAPKAPMFIVESKRIRWITKTESKRLIKEVPEHIAEMIRFSLATGLRHRNVTQLKWSQLNMTRRVAWIHPDESKTKNAITVPLNSDAIDVLKRQFGKHDEFVFTYNKKPVQRANTKAFREAVKRAGIEDFRWHDLRHTWASWHVQSGTDINTLQVMGGWKSIEMVQRYAHFSSDKLIKDAQRIVSHDTLTSQSSVVAMSK